MRKYTEDPLFTAIIDGDVEEIKRLKAQGAELSEKVKGTLSVKRTYKSTHDLDARGIEFDYLTTTVQIKAEDYVRLTRTLRDEIGETLYFMGTMWTIVKPIMFEEGVLECALDCFEHKMNKAQSMRTIIGADRADLLALCAKHGWLSQPKKRDEMLQFASENGSTECTAWLLEFKNKNFDLAAERAKADKKAERELNAAPDSITALKLNWSYISNWDRGWFITGYKGLQTEVVVPEKIGQKTVTAIGDKAFCPFAPRVTPEVKLRREAITKITLPETVRSIGDGAFWGCEELVSVNIPDGVGRINENTFADCLKLEKIIIPNSVKCIEKRAFFKCESLRFIEVPEGVELINEAAFALCKELRTLVLPGSLKYISSLSIVTITDKFVGAVVPKGSYAEEYCKKRHIPFSDKLVEVEPGSPKEKYCQIHGKPYIYKEDDSK